MNNNAKWTIKPATIFSLILEKKSATGNSEYHYSQAQKLNKYQPNPDFLL